MCSEDPDRLGWDVIDQHLSEDRMFSFRRLDQRGRQKIESYAAKQKGTVYRWDGYAASAAELIHHALDQLGAKHIMGFAAADNLASEAMMQSCGMKPSGRASYVVSLSQKPFTR